MSPEQVASAIIVTGMFATGGIAFWAVDFLVRKFDR